ncbi:MAG: hypothetical protein IT258_22350 [Saprospiraceae bacterium]|nr:hypothetical protein [Saprospiraceae bacterium]
MKNNAFQYLLWSMMALGLPRFLAAQTVTVSEPIYLRDEVSYDIFGDERGNVLLFRNKGTQFQVQGFDANLHLSWEKDLELDRKAPAVEAAVQAQGGGFNLIYQFRSKLLPILKIHRYSPAANLIDSITIKRFDQALYSPSFEVEFSEDKNIALIWYVQEQTQIHALAFDMQRMKLLWEKAFALDDLVLYRDFQQALVDNAGNMCFILSKDNFGGRNHEHYLEILDFGPATDSTLRRITVPMKNYQTFDVKFAFDNLHSTLKAGGLYSNGNTTRSEGYYFLSVPQARPDSVNLKFYPFDDDFVAILNEKERGKNKGIPEASVQRIVMRTDGGFILIGELNKELMRGGATNTSFYGRTGFRPVTDYYFDDIFLVSMHPDGSLHWKDILHKKQYSQDDNGIYSSFFLAKTPSALRLIYNDEIKHENSVSEYVVRGNGNYDRNAVMSTERKELQLRFRDAVQISGYDFVVPSERRNRMKLVRISFKSER